jgi:hypothetical protein
LRQHAPESGVQSLRENALRRFFLVVVLVLALDFSRYFEDDDDENKEEVREPQNAALPGQQAGPAAKAVTGRLVTAFRVLATCRQSRTAFSGPRKA